MSDFKFNCPHCQQRLACDEQHSGRQIQCPKCDHLIRIPHVPGKTAQYKPESGRTWDTFGPSGKGQPPKGLSVHPKPQQPKLPEH